MACHCVCTADFKKFQRNFLSVYLIMVMSDWMQVRAVGRVELPLHLEVTMLIHLKSQRVLHVISHIVAHAVSCGWVNPTSQSLYAIPSF